MFLNALICTYIRGKKVVTFTRILKEPTTDKLTECKCLVIYILSFGWNYSMIVVIYCWPDYVRTYYALPFYTDTRVYTWTYLRNKEKLIDDLMFGEEDAEKIIEQHREDVIKQEKKKIVFQNTGFCFKIMVKISLMPSEIRSSVLSKYLSK